MALSILHVTSPGSVGGLERVVQGLAAGHRSRGHRVRVAAAHSAGADLRAFCEPLRDAGVDVETVEAGRFSVLQERRFIRALCRAERTDILHTHGHRSDLLDSGVGRRAGAALCSTEHGITPIGARSGLYLRLQARAFRRFDAVVAVSQPIAERLRQSGVPEERLHLVPNAWVGDVPFQSRSDARSALHLSGDRFTIGWVGRLYHAKGADVFLRAMAAVQDLPLAAVVIGDGPELGNLKEQAASLGIADRVSFLGEIDRCAAYFRAFDLFVLSSRTEGTPLVLLEAMAAEVPTVVTTVGGVPDIVSDREAIRVPPENPEHLAAAIRRSTEEDLQSRARAERAKERVHAVYGRKQWLTRYEEIYESIVARRSA